MAKPEDASHSYLRGVGETDSIAFVAQGWDERYTRVVKLTNILWRGVCVEFVARNSNSSCGTEFAFSPDEIRSLSKLLMDKADQFDAAKTAADNLEAADKTEQKTKETKNA